MKKLEHGDVRRKKSISLLYTRKQCTAGKLGSKFSESAIN